jgi:hypothetical protein
MTRRRTNPVGVVAVPKESKQQELLFEWMELIRVPVEGPTPEGEWLPLSTIAFAVPNGVSIAGTEAQRARYMAALKRQGFRTGVSDIVIPYPRGTYHGLFVELKRDKHSVVSKDQKDWRLLMRRLGYRAEIVIGWDEARRIITEYVGTHRTVSRPSSPGLVI